MACILSITGKNWDVEDFAARSGAKPDECFRRGEMTKPPGAYRIKVSGMKWVLGPDGFVSLRRQVAAATRFLEDARNHKWLRTSAREDGVSRTIEFGLPRMAEPVGSDYLPARLVALVGTFGLDLVLSHYPVDTTMVSRRALRRGKARVPESGHSSRRQTRSRPKA